jgi:hypothetical protein
MTRLLLALMLAAAPEAAGTWTMVQTTFNDEGPERVDCTFKQEGSKLQGRCGWDTVTGIVADDKVSWEIVVNYDNHTATLYYAGYFDSQTATIRGDWACPKHCENAAYKKGTFVLTPK